MGPSWPSVRDLANFRFSLVISGVAGGTREQDKDKIIAFSRSGRLGKGFPSDPGFAKLFQKPDHPCRPTVRKANRSQSDRLSGGSSVHHPWHRGSVVLRFTVARPRRRNQTRSVDGNRTRIATCQELDARDETEKRGMQDARETRRQKCTSSFRHHSLPFPIPGSRLAAQCSPFRRAMIGNSIGPRRKSKSRDFTSPE
jgi:hypothetical protein